MICKKGTAIFLIMLTLSFQVHAETAEEKEVPQWLKDLRRWEIVAFGSIPFTMFTATFAMDMYRWSQANNMDFSDTGRRYAPWPLKSAGAIAMESKEQELTITLAASLSVAIAVTDLIIVQVKRNKARKRAEALPSGTIIINRTPFPEEEQPQEEIPEPADESQEAAAALP